MLVGNTVKAWRLQCQNKYSPQFDSPKVVTRH